MIGFRRIVLNDPPAGEPAGAEAAERLQAAMLAARAAHTDGHGRVDYRGLARSAELAQARAAARALGGVAPERLADRGTRLAFWINVYNALVFHGIVALGVRRSVREVFNFFGRIAYRVDGLTLTADEIEHGLLRGNRRRFLPPLRAFRAGDPRLAWAPVPADPRMHFAVTCGAASCPPVAIYRGRDVDAQLDRAARSFVNQEVGLDAGRVTCSRVFKWYGGDFEAAGGLAAFLVRHLDDGPARRALEAGAAPCAAYRPYRWSLQHPAVE
jgi:hypothetical protein